MKNIRLLFLILVLGIFTAACGNQATIKENHDEENKVVAYINFKDDEGKQIELYAPCKRIISLYSAHTENLFTLGLDEEIIGIGISDNYPVNVSRKDVFDYKSDPEKVIAADPDLVIIRPFINRKVPNFVKAIENAGITVVSLYPESLDEFDGYIEKLGMLTGKEQKSKELLKKFYEDIDNTIKKTKDIEPKMNVYFESTEAQYRTVTPDSMPGQAILFAGGLNVAKDAEPIKTGSSIAPFGIEAILENADNIDVYVSQRGAMNSGGNEHSIPIRPGFDTIKAIQDGKLLLINQKLISSPTFRYYKGVRELARIMYPEIMDDFSDLVSDEKITRGILAEILVKYKHKPIYVPSSSKYYKRKHKGHTYGFFEDVVFTDEKYDYIETAVMAGWIEEIKEKQGENIKEYFYPSNNVTKDELAKTIFLLGEFKRNDTHVEIKDLDKVKNKKIVQILVDHNIFQLDDNGLFNPKEVLTINEVVNKLFCG